jgi:hypothetical protein
MFCVLPMLIINVTFLQTWSEYMLMRSWQLMPTRPYHKQEWIMSMYIKVWKLCWATYHCCTMKHETWQRYVLKSVTQCVYSYTRCNRIRYTTLKTYCDQTNSSYTTQFHTEHLLTFQIVFISVQYGCHWLCGRHPYNILINAIALIGVTFLDKLWDELEYRLDVCRVNSGSHIEHL